MYHEVADLFYNPVQEINSDNHTYCFCYLNVRERMICRKLQAIAKMYFHDEDSYNTILYNRKFLNQSEMRVPL